MASVFNLRRTVIGAGEEAEQARAARGGAHVLQDMGTILRERREAMGISLAEAEAATRIRQKYVSALENNEWAVLPGEVVGRGFLRNYSSYLGLDTTEMMERRRAAADPRLAASLANVSVGATLPPERAIDYRPMNVDIKDEPDAIQGRNLRLRPILTGLGVLIATLLLVWGVVNFGDDMVRSVAGLPARLADAVASAEEAAPIEAPTVTPIVPVAGGATTVRSSGPLANLQSSDDVQANSDSSNADEAAQAAVDAERNADTAAAEPGSADTAAAEPGSEGSDGNVDNGDAGDSDPAAAPATEGDAAEEAVNTDDGATGEEESEEIAPEGEVATEGTDGAEGVPTEPPGEQGGEQVAEPAATPTFTALPPTPTLVPEPPTATPEPPTPEPAPVVAAAPAAAAACADPGTQIFSPGVNQAVAGTVEIVGAASSPIFQEYKLEWAPAGTESFNWFSGASTPVESGVLGYFDSAAVPAQAIDLRLTVVDNTGNFQPPCVVTINVQN